MEFETTGFDEIAQQFERVATQLPTHMADMFPSMGMEVEESSKTAIAAVTPHGWTNALEESTMATTDYEGTRSFTVIEQPAASLPDLAGNWGGLHYVQWVLPPGRGAFSSQGKMLRGPHFGPSDYSSAFEGNPYPFEANEAISSGVEAAGQRYTQKVLDWVLGA